MALIIQDFFKSVDLSAAPEGLDSISDQLKAFSFGETTFAFDSYPTAPPKAPESLRPTVSRSQVLQKSSSQKKKERQRQHFLRLLGGEVMVKGKVVDGPLSFSSVVITKSFLQTALGKKALAAVEISDKEKASKKTAQEQLLSLNFENGTCKGQSYAIMVASRKQKEDGVLLLGSIRKNHAIFFQAVERFRNVQRTSSESGVLITWNYQVEQIALDVLEELSGLRRVVKEQFDLLEKTFQQSVTKFFDTPKLEAIQISLNNELIGPGHSIVALLGSKHFIYDSARESGLYEYSLKVDLISDLFAYFSKHQKEENPLRYIILNGFAQVKEEHKVP